MEPLERRALLSSAAIPGLPEGSVIPLWQEGAVEYFVIGKHAPSWNAGTLWRSDGTSAGTFKLAIADAQTYNIDGEYVKTHASDGKTLFLITEDDSFGGSSPKLWKVDVATGAGTFVRDFQAATNFTTALLNGIFYFSAQDSSKRGEELWRSDGTAAGTYILNDLIKGPASSHPKDFAVLGNQVYFNANLDQDVHPLLATDGTARGTRLVVRIPTGSFSGFGGEEFTGPYTLQALGSRLLFRIRPENPLLGDEQLYVTDGTAKGTSALITNTSNLTFMGTVGDYALFINNDGDVWSTNGTGKGTHLLHKESWQLDYILHGRAYFSQYSSSSSSNSEPAKFSTDGTAKGTADGPAAFDTGFTSIGSARPVAGGVVFQGSLRNQQSQWFFTDGTIAGSRVIDLGSSSAYLFSQSEPWTTDRPRLFFSTSNYSSDYTTSLGTYAPYTGNIAGFVFDDLNEDGIRQSNEGALPGYKVFLDRNGDGICNKNENWTRATRTGRFTFGCVAAGRWSLRIVGAAGRHATTAEVYRVTVTAEQTITRNFGRAPSAFIAGCVYWDKNLDKHRQSNTEPGLEGEAVFIDFDADNHIDKGDIVAYTDAAGKYILVPPAPGTYTVHLIKKSGPATTPKNGTGLFTVGATGITLADFGVAVG
jgi:ELWxxDGT repeat protein